MRRFLTVLYVATALCHVPFALGLHHALALAGVPGAPLLALAAAAGLTALLHGRIQRAKIDRPIPRWRYLLIEEPYFVHWGAVIAALPLSVVLIVVSYIGALFRNGEPLITVGRASLIAYLAGAALAGWGVLVRRRWVRVRTIDVPIAGLGPRFDGYRIAHLSDLHIGSHSPRARGERWAKRVNRLDVDLVALTGDYVTSGDEFHRDIAAVLSNMRARDGVVAVMGNHDYFGSGEGLVRLLREGGVEVLRNEWRLLEREGDRMTLAGVDDTWTRRADVGRSLRGRDPGIPVIALAHDPSLFPKLAREGAALVLSGHTHWGQIAAPFLAARYNISRLSYRYHADLYREGDSTLYIHPGLGTTGPPIRIGSPPEITILRLCRAPTS